MKSLINLVFVVALCSRVSAAEHVHFAEPDTGSTNTLSLDFVLSEVLSNNPSIKAAQAKWEAMKERAPQARAWEDPRLGFETTAGRFVNVPDNSFTDQRLVFEQTIPVTAKNHLRENVATAEAAASYEQLRRAELDAVMKTRRAYFAFANAFAQYDVNKSTRALLKQFVEITRTKYEAGSQSQADVLAAETEATKLEESAVDLIRDISEAQTQLNVLMNRRPDSALGRPEPLKVPQIALTPEKIEGLALTHRPELIAAKRKIDAASAQLEISKRDKIPEPSIKVEGDRYNAANTPVSEFIVGASINLPWFNRKKYDAAIRENKKMVESAEHELEATRLETLGEIRDLLRKLETFRHHTSLAQGKLLELTRQTVESKRLSYETDKSSFLDLLMAERSAQEIESMYWMHITDYQSTVAELEALIGVKLDSISETNSQKEAK